MSETKHEALPIDEGGLRAPPHLKGWRKAWWWFDFIILVKLARLRFVAVLVAIGAGITQWDTLVAHYEKWTRPVGDAVHVAGDIEWFCPMHPSVVRDNGKDKCPVCFMPLSKRKKGNASDEALPAGVVSRVQLSPYRVVLAGVQTWTVAYVPLTKQITAVGYVDFNERGFKTVSARVKGRIDSLISAETGKLVAAEDELAAIYSPELNVTVQTLVDAQKRNNADLVKSSQQRLRLLGISDDQIDQILKTGEANTHLRIRSPISGHIVKKYVREGQYVDEGMPLYDIVDLSTVWIQAQVYEHDFRFLPAEQHGDVSAERLPVMAITQAFPDEPFHGFLSFIYPHVDQETRTVTVRFEIPNPGHKLRPGTTAEVLIDVPPSRVPAIAQAAARNEETSEVSGTALAAGDSLRNAAEEKSTRLERGEVLAVPEGSIIDTGRQKIVYRQVLPGEFEGVLVQLGPRMAGPNDVTFFPVLSGLEAGELIVTSGSFLVDAETRLNPAAGSIYIGGSSGGGVSSPSKTMRPSTPADTDAKIDLAFAKLSPEDRKLAASQKFCPVLTESRLGSMGVPVKVLVNGQPVFVCCNACSKQAAEADATLKKVAELRARTKSEGERGGVGGKNPASTKLTPQQEKITKALAKLSPADRSAAEKQKFCALLPKIELGSMGTPIKLLRDGQPLFLCCESCLDSALEKWPTAKRAEKVTR
ncbi:MAG: efflux RND transporter periplasmic adaptor subunit [Planctomycetaceae bacterium]|nr:efflux RND transporter periplasmic adaptor subunit [Planctomycetaceae bacterium]